MWKEQDLDFRAGLDQTDMDLILIEYGVVVIVISSAQPSSSLLVWQPIAQSGFL
jgi:hypothetical protein